MSTNPALEAWIRAHPDDWDGWRVYADWLLEHGDIRGELVHLEHRLRNGALSLEEAQAAKKRVGALIGRSRSLTGARRAATISQYTPGPGRGPVGIRGRGGSPKGRHP